MSLNKAQFIFAKNLVKLIMVIFESGYQCSIGEVFRTKEQAEIYAKTGRGIIDSLHCYKLAADINLFKNGEYITDSQDFEKFGLFWKRLHTLNRWGGDFSNNDANHFEMNAKEGI